MAQQEIFLGTVANDDTGDTARTGGDKINDNFTELYSLISALTVLTDGLSSGIYTPTIANILNLDGSASFESQWLRVGSVVTVSGRVSVDPTLPDTATQLSISLPVASNLSAVSDCCGVAAASNIAGQSAAILGSVADDTARLSFISGDTTSKDMFFTFTYEVKE